jgi:heme iron utilization protein
MTENAQDPIRPTDDEARALARNLLRQARFAALAVTDPETGMPYVSRVALGATPSGQPLTLISGLALHTRALQANQACALLVGEPGHKGDALAHPRLTVQAVATALPRNTPEHAEMAPHYLRDHPKSKLYLSLGDFGFTLFTPTRAYLNGGFGRAFVLTAADLGL